MESIPGHLRHGPADLDFPPPGGPWEPLALNGRLVGWAGTGGAVLLILALNRFFLPSRFSVDHEGITANHPLRSRRLRWTDVRRFVHDGRGGYLSTMARPSRLDAWRGMHILFGDQRQGVIDQIHGRLMLTGGVTA